MAFKLSESQFIEILKKFFDGIAQSNKYIQLKDIREIWNQNIILN